MSKDKKKIGILACWESNRDYGEQLQIWAFQAFLCSIGYDAFLIRVRMYTNEPIKCGRLAKITLSIKKIFAKFLILLTKYNLKNTMSIVETLLGKDWAFRQYDRFHNKNIIKTNIYNSYLEFTKNHKQADVYVVVGDKIWNVDLSQEKLNMVFLQFTTPIQKRISYATCISYLKTNKLRRNFLLRCLKSFNMISSCDDYTINFCKKIGIQCEYVLDATMLLSANTYNKIIKSKIKYPYIYVYANNFYYMKQMPTIENLRNIVKIPNCKCVITDENENQGNKIEGVTYDLPTLPDWLSYIKNAKLVVTDSFHGIVFSILFHRDFIFTPNHKKDVNYNSRVYTLLHQLGISGRVWGNIDVECPINWKKVDYNLSLKRTYSISYILNNL